MLRRLFSVPLCAFALLLLMGASFVPEQASALLNEEESAVIYSAAALETDFGSVNEAGEPVVQAAAAVSPLEAAEEKKEKLFLNGTEMSDELHAFREDGTTYVCLSAVAQAMDETAQFSWNKESGEVSVKTQGLELTAKAGQKYVVANGRYLYLPEGIHMDFDRVTVPLWVVAKAFDATVEWDGETESVIVTSGSGAIESGDSFYVENDLFWLSRIIYAESGNQPLEGQMAVGNVVMNRVDNPVFPDTVKGVISQKNQFSPYKSGALANRTPNASSVIAAKLVLDGGVVEETEGALYFDSSERSWAARNKECIAAIGGHKFYR